MGWLKGVAMLITFQYIAWCVGLSNTEVEFPQSYRDTIEPEASSNIIINQQDLLLSPDPEQNTRLDLMTHYLANILVYPWPEGTSPLLYIEQKPYSEEDLNQELNNELTSTMYKRSKYYRKYPWKRQNKYMYDSNPYYCTPTKEDVFRLLVALHEARQGNRGRTVNFCNRKRPATAVFTNIRFLGKRK